MTAKKFPGFNFDKTVKTKNTNQRYWNAEKNFDTNKLDKTVPDILKDKKIRGVLIVQDVYNKELKHKTTVSKYITRRNVHKIKSTIYEYMNSRIFGLAKYQGYKMKSLSFRIVENR